jgi:nitrogen fixation NifU-like protein
MAYSNKVLDHFQNPKNMGSMNKSNHNVGTGIVGAPACGDVMKLQLRELSLPPVKIHCSVLAEDAIKAAIKNWEEKRDGGNND